jgi:hypothetical protein
VGSETPPNYSNLYAIHYANASDKPILTMDAGNQLIALVWVEKILFADGTYWNDTGSHSCQYQGAQKTRNMRKK